MFGLIAGIIAAVACGVAVGKLIAHAIILTIRWLKNKINEKFADKNVKKVAVADLGELINSCRNEMSREQLNSMEELRNKGYTHLTATVDNYGRVDVDDVEVIRNTSNAIDDEVDQFINRTGEGMVVITR